ncbi:VOC family protein [Anaerosporobacter faecicola]|uniref:VOC family protein n=1 Tax=Anaerosporobacter faecicola TaxID=2718714 RepID=UPI00143B4339|nr:VOC family protein [Anaerosporobacter faecicola]
MPIITPNFVFNGQCEEAIQLYQKAFQAEVTVLLRYSDAQVQDLQRELTQVEQNYIYHAELTIGNQRIMMADNLPESYIASGMSLTITMDTKEEVERAFRVMEEKATIILPLHRTTYSSCTVSFVDQFGFRWVIMTEQVER